MRTELLSRLRQEARVEYYIGVSAGRRGVYGVMRGKDVVAEFRDCAEALEALERLRRERVLKEVMRMRFRRFF